jgi:predicted TPR repeat methyltransferase
MNIKKELNDSNLLPLIQFYDQAASTYSDIAAKAQYKVPAWLSTRLRKYKGVSPAVTDLACGNGLVGQIFEENNIITRQMYGYDISNEMLLECGKNKIYSHVSRCDLSQGLPTLADMSVDIITAFGLFEFLPNLTEILNDIKRILVTDGEIFCTFEASNSNMDEESNFPGIGGDIKHYQRTEASIIKLFAECGLTIISIEKDIGYISPSKNIPVYYYFVHAIRK